MADYVSILKRTLDGLGDKATPALRERVYGRARDAVKRQLDGMNPPPAEDVVAKQYDTLERAIAEVEAGYGDAAPVDAPAPPEADAPESERTAPDPSYAEQGGAEAGQEAVAAAPDESEPVGEDAPAEAASDIADTPQSMEDAGDPGDLPDQPPAEAEVPAEPDADRGELPELGTPPVEDPVRPDERVAPSTAPPASVAGGEPIAHGGPDLLPEADAEFGGDASSEHAGEESAGELPPVETSATGDVPVADDVVVTPEDPVSVDPVAPVDMAGEPPVDQPPAPASFTQLSDPSTVSSAEGEAELTAEPREAEAAGSDLPPLPSASAEDVDPLLTTAAGAVAAGGAANLAASIRDGSFYEREPGAEGATSSPPGLEGEGPAIELPGRSLEESIPPRAEIGPHGDPVLDASRAMPLAASGTPASALPQPPGGLDPSLFAEPDYVPGETVDVRAGGTGEGPSMPKPAPLEANVASPSSVDASLAPVVPSAPAVDEPAKPAPSTATLPRGAQAGGSGQAATRERKRGGAGGWLAAAVLVFGLVFGGWYLRDEIADATGVEGFRTAFGLQESLDGLLGTGDEEPTVVVEAPDPTETGPAEVVATDPPPSDPPADPPAPTGSEVAATEADKFQDRLPGGEATAPTETPAEVDVAPTDTDVAVRDVPTEPTDGDGNPTADGDGTTTADAADATDEASTPPEDAGEVDVAAADPVDPASPASDARSFLIEEPLGGQPATPSEGGVSWSVVSESPGNGLPPEPAIRGEVRLQDGLGLSVTVRRNADATLPASHLIELVFALPEDFGGNAIQTLPLVGFKDSLQVAARPLVAVPAKITDDFFLVGLNNLATAIESNLELMSSEDFMDVQLVYGTGRRATLTLEKGDKGNEVFAEVLQAWRNAPLPG